MKKICLIAIVYSLFSWASAFAGTASSEKKVNDYFAKIQQNPIELYRFLYQMPKGGDLHNHFSGATYAENLIHYGRQDPYCIKMHDFTVTPSTQCQIQQKIAAAQHNDQLYNSLINAWSMHNFVPGKKSRADHFFSTFEKFGFLVSNHAGDVLAEIVDRAGNQHVSYLELMLTAYDLNLFGPEGERTSTIGKKIGWDNDLLKLREKLLKNGLDKVVSVIPKRITAMEKTMQQQLKCGKNSARPGCGVTVRYQYIALRGLPPQEFYAQLVTAFEAAKIDKRIVGINIVQAEDGPIATRDYHLHMKMLDTLHKLYPQVNITLHAGELAAHSASPETLRFHIQQAIETGHAQRIGHGVAIGYEDNSEALLAKMAKQQVMVEINLTSNDSLLGVRGKSHPFPLYLKHRVPVALSTDDEGVLRTFITREYQRAVRDYQLDYPTLKMLVRNSLTYSFMPGANLWQKANSQEPQKACARDALGAATPSAACQQFLKSSAKAQLQWQLEQQLQQFEQQITQQWVMNK